MDSIKTNEAPKITKETKNKIRVEFDRTPLKERLKAKYFNFYFVSKVIIWIFRMVLMIGISYIVIYPFISKITSSIMAPADFVDVTVRLIPKTVSLDIYRAIFKELGYWSAFRNTFILSISCAIIQTFICALIGYGFAKFKFKGRNLIFILVILTMIIPHQTLQLSMFMKFRYFDILGLVKLFKGGGISVFGHNIMNLGAQEAVVDEAGNIISEAKDGVFKAFFEKLNILPDSIKIGRYFTEKGLEKYRFVITMDAAGMNTTNTYVPLVLLSLTGLAFKNGLYIFLFRQFYRGIPDELEESAYMDGCGTFHTFISIILPNSVPMLVTVFLFSFCWQWTDDFYTTLLMPSSDTNLLVTIVDIPTSLKTDYPGQSLYYSAIRNTCGLLIIAPLVILYSFCQNFLVQGIEHSGIAN